MLVLGKGDCFCIVDLFCFPSYVTMSVLIFIYTNMLEHAVWVIAALSSTNIVMSVITEMGGSLI